MCISSYILFSLIIRLILSIFISSPSQWTLDVLIRVLERHRCEGVWSTSSSPAAYSRACSRENTHHLFIFYHVAVGLQAKEQTHLASVEDWCTARKLGNQSRMILMALCIGFFLSLTGSHCVGLFFICHIYLFIEAHCGV